VPVALETPVPAYRERKGSMARKLTSQKRADLIAAATRVFKKKGFRDASVKDIVGEAGASTATFYRYFHTKDEIYEEIVMGFLAGFAAIWQQTYESLSEKDLTREQTLERMAEAFRAILDYYRFNRDVAKVVFRRVVPIDERFAEQGDMIVDATVGQLSEVLENARRTGIARHIEPEVAAAVAIGGVFGVAIECVVEGKRDDVGKIVDEVMEVLQHGITREK
jgi:AcrR family transcriptional regulator